MAKPVTIKRRISSTEWETIYPKTTIGQVEGISTIAGNLLNYSTAVSTPSIIKVNSDNTVSMLSLDDLRVAIEASHKDHTHTLDHLDDWETTMANYADLEGGVVKGSQLPSWVVGGLKVKGALPGNITLDDDFRKSASGFDIAAGLTNEQVKFHSGKYFIIEPSSGNEIIVTVTGDNKIVGEEGSGVIESGGTITLEAGDWIVFRGKEGSKFVYDIVNNTYQRATTNFYGTAKITTATNRAGLSGQSYNVIDEKALKSILKTIHYTDDLGSLVDVQIGDIVFEYEN